MPKYLPLPGGNSLEVPDEMSYNDAMAAAQQKFPQLFEQPKPPGSTGGISAFTSGLRSGLGSTAQGLGEFAGLQSLADFGKAQRERATQTFRPTSKEDIEEAAKRGLFPEAGAYLSKYITEPVGETTGNIIGRYGLPTAAGAAAALAAPQAAVGATAAEIAAAASTKGILSGAGFAAANAPTHIGENIAAQKELGQAPDRLSATIAGLGQAAIDQISGHLLAGPMRGIIGKTAQEQAAALAPDVLAGKITADTASRQISGTLRNVLQSTAQNAVVGSGMMAGNELLTRAATGQPLTSPDARAAYLESLKTGVAMSPMFGLMQGLGAKGSALAEIDRAQKGRAALDAEAQQKAAQEQQTKEAEQKSSPEYLQSVAEKYKNYQAQITALKQQAKAKVAPDDFAGKLAQQQAGRQVAELTRSDEFKNTVAEYLQAQQSGAFKRLEETAPLPKGFNPADLQTQRGLEGFEPGGPQGERPLTEAEEQEKQREITEERYELARRLDVINRAREEHQTQESAAAGRGDIAAHDALAQRRNQLEDEHSKINARMEELGGDIRTNNTASQTAILNQLAKKQEEFKSLEGPGYDPAKADKLKADIKELQAKVSQPRLDLGRSVKSPTSESQMDFFDRLVQQADTRKKEQAEKYLNEVQPEVEGIQQLAINAGKQGPLTEAQRQAREAFAAKRAGINLADLQPREDLENKLKYHTDKLNYLQYEAAVDKNSPQYLKEVESTQKEIADAKNKLAERDRLIQRLERYGEDYTPNALLKTGEIGALTRSPAMEHMQQDLFGNTPDVNLPEKKNLTETYQRQQPQGGTQYARYGNKTAAEWDSAFNPDFYRKDQGPIVTGDTEKAPKIQKAPGQFNLRSEATGRAPTVEETKQRLTRALSDPNLDNNAYRFLRRAEEALNTPDFKIAEERKGVTPTGKTFKDTAESDSLLNLIHEQLNRIERGEEGRAAQRNEGAPRTREVGTLNPIVKNRINDINEPSTTRTHYGRGPGTVRGPAAREITPAKPLSLEREMEPLLRRIEQAKESDMGQGELFGNEDERRRQMQAQKAGVEAGPAVTRGYIKPDRAAFQRFLNSPFVNTLRKQIRETVSQAQKDIAILKRAKEVPALKAKVETLKNQIEKMHTANQKFSEAEQLTKDGFDRNKFVIKRLEAQGGNLNAQLLELDQMRMQLEQRHDELKALKNSYERERAKNTGITTPAYGDYAIFGKEYETVNKELADVTDSVGNIHHSMQTLDSLLKVEKARNEWARLNLERASPEEIAQAKEQLRAAGTNASDIQRQISEVKARQANEAAVERRRQQAIALAERDRNAAEKAKEEQKRLEAIYGDDTASREMLNSLKRYSDRKVELEPEDPELLAAMNQVLAGKDPKNVIGGLAANYKRIERQYNQKKAQAQAHLESSREAAIGPYRKKLEALEERFKNTPSADAREKILTEIDLAQKTLSMAEQHWGTKEITWKGMAEDKAELQKAMELHEFLRNQIDEGRLVMSSKDEGKPAKEKADKETRAQLKEALRRERARAMQKEGPGAATTGEALTRTEAKEAREAEKTLYSGKGVGPMSEDLQRRAQELTQKEKQDRADKIARIKEKVKNGETLNPFEEHMLASMDNSARVRAIDERIQAEPELKAAVEKAKSVAKEAPKKETKQAKKVKGAEEPAVDKIPKHALTKADQAILDEYGESEISNSKYLTEYSGEPRTNLSNDNQERLANHDLVGVLNDLARTSKSPLIRESAARLAPLVEKTKTRIVSELKQDGKSIPALYESGLNRISFHPDGLNEEDLIHEAEHAATIRNLNVPNSELTKPQINARNEIFTIFSKLKNDKVLEGEYAAKTPEEFVAEVRSNQALRDKLKDTPWFGGNMLQRLFAAFKRLIGLTPKTALEAADAHIKNLESQSRRYVPERPEPAPGAYASIFRKAQPTSAIIGTEPSKLEKLEMNLSGLAPRVQYIDRLAAADAAIVKAQGEGMLSSTEAFNAQYAMRLADFTTQGAGQFITHGPVKIVEEQTPNGVQYRYESTAGANVVNISEHIRTAAKAGNMSPEEAERMLTVSIAGDRAQSKNNGWARLLGSNPEAARAEYMKDKAYMDANPAVKQAIEAAKKEYKEVNDGALDFLEQCDFLSPEQVKELKSSPYIPYYRSEEGNIKLYTDNEHAITIGSIKDNPDLVQMLGGNDKILPITTSAVQNLFMITHAGLKNRATLKTGDALNKAGFVSKMGEGGGPANASTVRYKVKGKDYFASIDTDTFGIPAHLIFKGMEGIKTTIPDFVKVMGMPANMLRKFITRTPTYAVRQLIKDPMQSYIMSGVDGVPVVNALKEMKDMRSGRSEGYNDMMRGLGISSNVFSGNAADMQMYLRDIAAGKGGWDKLMSKFDNLAHQSDAAGRVVVYKDALAKGLSKGEAQLRAIESQNFYRRGLSPSIQILNTLIPFFNSQIQGIDALYRSLKGTMPFAQRLDVQRKIKARGALLAVGAASYAAMMQDDPDYQKATPAERYGNFFLHLPGLDEPVKVPVPYEAGILFMSTAQAVVDSAMGDTKGKEAITGLGSLLWQSAPNVVPAAAKPIGEAILNKTINGDIESQRERDTLQAGERYRPETSEVAKTLGGITGEVGISPIMLEHLMRGYTGSLGVSVMHMLDPLLGGGSESASTPLSKTAFVGNFFQSSEGKFIIDRAYYRMTEINQAKGTYESLLARGERARADDFAQRFSSFLAQADTAGSFKQRMGQYFKDAREIQSLPNLSRTEKDALLKQIKNAENLEAKGFYEASEKTGPQ